MLAAAPEECVKVFDINIRQHCYSREVIETSLSYADILKLNEDELPLVASLLELTGLDHDIVSVKFSQIFQLVCAKVVSKMLSNLSVLLRL